MILIKRSCTSVLITGILYKRSCRILIQVVQGSSHRDPETQILHKLSNRILIQWSNRIPIQWSYRILIQRSCTSGRTGPWHRDLVLVSYRILIQVVEKDPHTEILSEILHKCQKVVQKDPDAEILLQMSCEFTFASRRCTLTHTVWGLLPG